MRLPHPPVARPEGRVDAESCNTQIKSRLLVVCYALAAFASVTVVADFLRPVSTAGASHSCISDGPSALRWTALPPDSAIVEEYGRLTSAPGPSGLDGLVSRTKQAPPRLADNLPTIAEEDFNALLTGSSTQGGSVRKAGILEMSKWWLDNTQTRPPDAVKGWFLNQTMGISDGGAGVLPLGVYPPKAGPCTVLFSPIYKFVFIKNTKVAGTSVFLNFGGMCDDDMTFEKAKISEPCLWPSHLMIKAGPKALGYETFDELWQAYTVFALVRNPYDRAGSSYDYILSRREDQSGHCRKPPFPQFLARPYIVGLQDMLFGCQDAIHDLYHVEPQHECLVNSEEQLAVEFVVRVESLEADMNALIALLNSKKDDGLDSLSNDVGWAQKGPRANVAPEEDAELAGASQLAEDSGDVSRSRHMTKYGACGAACFHHVRAYYAKDFELLKYASVLDEGQQ